MAVSKGEIEILHCITEFIGPGHLGLQEGIPRAVDRGIDLEQERIELTIARPVNAAAHGGAYGFVFFKFIIEKGTREKAEIIIFVAQVAFYLSGFDPGLL